MSMLRHRFARSFAFSLLQVKPSQTKHTMWRILWGPKRAQLAASICRWRTNPAELGQSLETSFLETCLIEKRGKQRQMPLICTSRASP